MYYVVYPENSQFTSSLFPVYTQLSFPLILGDILFIPDLNSVLI